MSPVKCSYCYLVGAPVISGTSLIKMEESLTHGARRLDIKLYFASVIKNGMIFGMHILLAYYLYYLLVVLGESSVDSIFVFY